MRIGELYTRHVVTARKREPLLDAILKMRKEHVGTLVVVVEEGSVPVPVLVPIGILTDRDVVVGVLAKDGIAHISSLDVGDVMTTDLVTATLNDDASDVLHRMRSFGVRRVPVIDPKTHALEGIVSIDNILAGLANELSKAAQLISQQPDREVGRRS